ncbi:hypothetical protein KAW18_05345 [candidate division WOR-3 bacterium]|nr:hypothetical protein [candidate division WOR-3 bacterium]
MVSEEERAKLFERKARDVLEARRDIKKFTRTHKERVREQIKKVKDVRGVGIGEREILILVDERKPIPVLPTEIEGVPVKIERTSEFVIYPNLTENKERKEVWRPAPGGVAIGHKRLGGYGTLGGIVLKGGVKYILSNNHVLARSNSARIGDQISQPWREYTIGTLSEFVPVKEGCTVDCAIAKPHSNEDISELILVKNDYYEPYVYTTGVMEPYAGEKVIKSGARTGFVEGKIEAINTTLEVNYGKFTITLKDQLYTNRIGLRGDSGSLVLDKKTNKAVGLLFCGSKTGNGHNDINNVLKALGCTISTSIGVVPQIGKLDISAMPDKGDIWVRER